MAEIFLRKRPDGLLEPDTDTSEQYIKSWKVNDVHRAEVRKPRNYEFHKKFFALVKVVYENQDRYDTMKDVLTEIKLRTGHYHEHVTLNGVIIYVPKSIAFANMDEFQFQQFYDKAIGIILKHFFPRVSEADLRGWVDEIIGFT